MLSCDRRWPLLAAALSLTMVVGAPQASAQAPQPYPYPYPPPPYQPYPYPPPYGYPPPPQPYPAPPPAPLPPQPPAVVYDWDPDVPVPAGYTMVDTVNSRLLVSGITLLATGWLLSLLAAGIGSSGEAEEADDAADGVTAGDWMPLYLPAVGPFIAIGTLDPSPAGTGLLLADGVLQVGGAIGIVASIVDRNYKLVRHGYGGLSVKPAASLQFRGLVATGRF